MTMAVSVTTLLGLLAGDSDSLRALTMFLRRHPKGRAPVFGRVSSSIAPPLPQTRGPHPLFSTVTTHLQRVRERRGPSKDKGLLFPGRDAVFSQARDMLINHLEGRHGR